LGNLVVKNRQITHTEHLPEHRPGWSFMELGRAAREYRPPAEEPRSQLSSPRSSREWGRMK
jgi:hypothetical protein